MFAFESRRPPGVLRLGEYIDEHEASRSQRYFSNPYALCTVATLKHKNLLDEVENDYLKNGKRVLYWALWCDPQELAPILKVMKS